MQVVYAKQEPPQAWKHAIFLAGPTPRDPQTPSWRPEALKILEDMGYEGVVFVPEHADGKWQGSYQDQVEWEEMGLEMADKIVFWVPRDLRTMPALTTNVEFGRYVQSGKAVLGHPDGAEKMRYLDWLADQNDTPVFTSLRETLERAVSGWEAMDLRQAGERWVPDAIWATPMFQSWYGNLKEVGNRLDEAKVLWTFTIPGKPELGIFSYVMWVKVWIAAEGRWKENEWVFSRTDLACVVLHRMPANDPQGISSILDEEVILVREFRSPARTPDGLIHETPGGSCEAADNDAKVSAAREVYEETGLAVGLDRLRYVGSRQAVGTLSSHQVHCYAVEVNGAEMEQAKKLAADDTTFGEEQDTELTYVEVTSLREMMRSEVVDWTTVGCVMGALVHTF